MKKYFSWVSSGIAGLCLFMAAMMPGQALGQCVACFTNASGDGRWDNNGNWIITARQGGTPCGYSSISALMAGMATAGAGYVGHEVVITAPVKDNTGQPAYPVFDNLTITAEGRLTTGGNSTTFCSIRRQGTLQVDGVLNVPGTLQLNFAFSGEPALPTSTRMVISPGGMVNVGNDFSLQNSVCSDGTKVVIDGTMVVADDMYGNQQCRAADRPITGTGIFVAFGGCNTDNNNDKIACPSFCQMGKCPSSELPVELLGYTAEAGEQGVVVRWETATELNNSHFVLSRSMAGGAFYPIVRVEGSGTTQEPKAYGHTDQDADQGVVYYMLEQYDYDGTRHLLGVREVFVSGRRSITVFPNPVPAGAAISGKVAGSAEEGRVELLSPAGRVLDWAAVKDGAFSLRGQTVPGVYFTRVTLGNGRVVSATLLIQ